MADLHGVQLRVHTVRAQQRLVRPALDDRAAVHHEDLVGVMDRRQPVRDHERRAAGHQPIQRLEDHRLRPRIDRRGRLVEDENRRVLQERPGDADALALAAGQPDAALADRRLVAPGSREMKSCALAAVAAATISSSRGVELAVADVVGDRAREQHRILRHEADVVAQRSQRERADVMAVDQDPPFVRVVEARDQAGERRLAGAGGADDGDDLAWSGIEGDLLQRVDAARIAEADAVEGHTAFDAGNRVARRPPPGRSAWCRAR